MTDPIRILGVDMASQDSGTAACELEADATGVRVAVLEVGLDNQELATRIRGCDWAGIDAPFGWPRAFVGAIASWHGERTWPGDDDPAAQPWRHEFTLRATETAVWERVGHRPISVSTDRIAYAAMRTAHVLGVLDSRPDDSGVWTAAAGARIVEVYPAGTLRALGLAARGYKGRDGTGLRAELARSVVAAWPELELPDPLDALVGSDHGFDAWIAAVTAWRASLHATIGPSAGDVEAARLEGWIHLPRVSG